MADGDRPDPRFASRPPADGDARAPSYLTITQLADRTNLSVATIRRLVKRKRITAHQPGGPGTKLVFPPDAIERAPASPSAPNAPPSKAPAEPRHGPRPRWRGGS